MSLSDSQLRTLALAGTVSVPPRFPEVGRLSIETTNGHNGSSKVIKIEHVITPRLMIARSFFLSDVSAVFLPSDPKDVDFADGKWFLGPDIATAMGQRGIAYVREDARTLMQVEVGMTAAESVEYYPPLPGDRSVDHYNLSGAAQQASPAQFCSAASTECCAVYPGPEFCAVAKPDECDDIYPGAEFCG